MSSDDDFDKMVRRMFENFFKDAFGPDSSRTGIIRFGFQPTEVKEEANIELKKGKEPVVEKIDLGDILLIILEGYSSIDDLRIEVIEKTVIVDNGLDKEYIEIPFLVNVGESGYSFRNGILEIRLQKIDEKNKTEVKSTGILTIEN
jgi:HSP20 family molecular chaperone IbpA